MDEKKTDAVVEPVVEIDPIAKLQEENASLIEERDNYKNVALKRLGKLPGDAEFLAGDSGNDQLSVAEQIRLALLDKEIASNKKAQEDETKRILKENSELRLALKNRPGASVASGDSGSSTEVKDNVFSDAQIKDMTARAKRLNADPEKFIANAKANLLKHR